MLGYVFFKNIQDKEKFTNILKGFPALKLQFYQNFKQNFAWLIKKSVKHFKNFNSFLINQKSKGYNVSHMYGYINKDNLGRHSNCFVM